MCATLIFFSVHVLHIRMSSKIVKAGGGEADEFEKSVAQELANLEVCIHCGVNVLCVVCLL